MSKIFTANFPYIFFVFSLLENILVALKEHTDANRVMRVIKRYERLQRLEEYTILIDDFNMNFIVCLFSPFHFLYLSELKTDSVVQLRLSMAHLTQQRNLEPPAEVK